MRRQIAPPAIIAVDFDGTIVEHAYPLIGAPVPLALHYLRELGSWGHRVILYTMRSGETLNDAVRYLGDNAVNLWAVNENPDQAIWTQSPKVYANLYIDDAAAGCPLVKPTGSRPYVDWKSIGLILVEKRILPAPSTPMNIANSVNNQTVS